MQGGPVVVAGAVGGFGTAIAATARACGKCYGCHACAALPVGSGTSLT
jgi:hypothetical protein